MMRMDIELAIKQLPYDQREILSWHLNADLPFREISRITGQSLPATYRKYRKAIRTLQTLLGGGTI